MSAYPSGFKWNGDYLLAPSGKMAASIHGSVYGHWHWHCWDEDGSGGENDNAATLDEARIAAESAVLRWGRHTAPSPDLAAENERLRSAPIPPAEEIAAMREVCEAARIVGDALKDPGLGGLGPLELLEWIVKAQGSPEFGGDAECPFEMGELVDPDEEKRVACARSAVDALVTALAKLAAARAKGGV